MVKACYLNKKIFFCFNSNVYQLVIIYSILVLKINSYLDSMPSNSFIAYIKDLIYNK